MSLISDPEYLIHRIRLSYLRLIDDPYGPRLITLSPTYASNPHILASGLADPDRWPELLLPSSAPPTDQSPLSHSTDPRNRPSGFPGATGLKYSQTIVGPTRAGIIGLGVSRRRVSHARAPSSSEVQATTADTQQPKRLRSDSEPTPANGVIDTDTPLQNGAGSVDDATEPPTTTRAGKRRSASEYTRPDLMDGVVSDEKLEGQQSTEYHVQFIPKFKGAAEMEARRRLRMARMPRTRNVNGIAIENENESGNANGTANWPRSPVPAPEPLNPEFSSSDDEIDIEVDDEDDDEGNMSAEGNQRSDDELDEFDPDFAASQTLGVNSDSASDIILSAPNSVLSTSHSSAFGPGSPNVPIITTNPRIRHRLSPVSEHASDRPTDPQPSTSVDPSFNFEIVTPPPPTREDQRHNAPPTDTNTGTGLQPPKRLASLPAAQHAHLLAFPSPPPSSSSSSLFARCKVPPRSSTNQPSLLTSLLASTSTSTPNPFSSLYALISGRAETTSTTLQIYFPHARTPIGKAMYLTVRKDASVEEVVGFALWNYWEEGWLPKLDEGLENLDEDDQKRKTRLSAAGWILRVTEEDGEVDEDFPAPDRMAKISKFNLDGYAVIAATSAQVQQNRALEAKIVRRPSRIMAAKKKSETLSVPGVGPGGANGGLAPPSVSGPGSSTVFGSMSGSPLGLSTSLGPSSSHGPQVFLRIRIAETVDSVHVSTTIPVSAGMYMQEALELVCKKKKLSNPKEWALLLGDKTLLLGQKTILIPLDRTVASLQGQSELVLVRRSMLAEHGVDVEKKIGRTTDPNASIFKRMSEVPEESTAIELLTGAYKKYTVFKKMSMLVGQRERVLAVDGDYIHIMPSTNKARAVFDSGKTISYHIKSVVACQQSSKSSATFKLEVGRDGGSKRYDYEAESPKRAREIVETIKALKNSHLERLGTLNRARRSRQVA